MATIKKLLAKWTCNSGLHRWKIELLGQKYKGFVYPIRFRTCQRCKRVEHEIFDEINNAAAWVQVD